MERLRELVRRTTRRPDRSDPGGDLNGPRPAFVLALILGVIQVAGTFAAWHGRTNEGGSPPWSQRTGPWNDPTPVVGDVLGLDPLGVVLLVIGPVALVFRRRHPVGTLLVALGAFLAYLAIGYPYGPIFLAPAAAVIGAIVRGYRPLAWTVVAVVYGAVFGLTPLFGRRDWPTPAELTLFASLYLLVLLVGELVRFRRTRAAEAARIRRVEDERRVGEERLQIARELHDVVAHNISLINVQAGVALHLLDSAPEPDQTRAALTAIKGASKEALVELRSILGVLRQVDEDAPRLSAPSIGQLDRLAERFRAAGIEVEVAIDGTPVELPRAVDLAAYRIVQEALTNVLRHAGRPVTARITVTYAERRVGVEIADNGGGDPVSSAELGSGSGIIGMRERVHGLGGELHAAPGENGGFVVTARLPYENEDGGAAGGA